MDEIITSFGCLRPWRMEDDAAVAKYANNRAIWLNLRDGFPHPYGIEEARIFLNMAITQHPDTFYAIATPEEAVGSIGITILSDVHCLTAELGYWLAEPYWGRGIMSEAVRAFTDYAFERFGLVRIFAEPYARNAASCRVLEKAGFSLEGRMRWAAFKDGQPTDMFLYARIKE
jgi:ribosomal-protein-alanine N-acetyltransferase